ncbi:UvrD-helicase domain-containing protein [Polaromonas sp.]|jgi:ATP-dependent helicase/nuclease subunit A|uniref:UvrD-helicase domain-containing protein n=2 Tax=Polaromonas sp. TaxID=1869339 RepID=UPI002BB7C9EC|nr:UvrD-helicase domain-containing protein [Polaromonas sp.]HQS89784.1 UvrD-helicase domain-containing protein [Polaromonas sp.]
MTTTPSAAYQSNGRTVSAEAFYAIACDPRRSVAVEACAGSGKTWMLVSRIVRALLDGAGGPTGEVRPQEILAITFTKKAAGEMRERLDEWLKAFAHADDDTLLRELAIRGVKPETSSQKGLQPNQDLRRQLSNLYRSVLASGRSVQIRTFHSWFAALLRNAPVAVVQRLGLPVNYELLEDDKPARALVWRRFYAAVVADASLRADFDAVVQAHGRSQAGKALQAALDKRVEFALADEQGVVDASVQAFGAQFPEWAGFDSPEQALTGDPANRQLLFEAASALGRASAVTYSAKGAELEQALSAGDTPAVFAALLTATGSPRKFGEKIIGIASVRQAQDLVLRSVAACQQRDAWDYQRRMARLARALIAQFTLLKRERGWVDMNDVERAALELLTDPVLSGWVQERLDARIRHLMIDEFQDTNPLQWQALSSWLSGYGGAVGAGMAPSVFLVGDPKQSIYRFRRAEPQVFLAAQKFVVEGLGGDLLSCDHTRRNAVAVINTVNAVMRQAREADGYDGFREHTTASGLAGSVVSLPPIPRGRPEAASPLAAPWRDSLNTPRELPEETLRTQEARQAAAWIASQVACGLKPDEVMVLARKRAGLLPLQDELRALGIAAQIGEKTDLIECCEVLDIVALLDVLVSPQHDLSLARALRSPLFGLADASLVQLALLQRKDALPWHHLLQKTELLTHDLHGLGAILMRWKSWLDSLPPHDALQAIYDDGDVLARFAAAAPPVQLQAVLANLRALLAVALDLDGGRYATPYGLVRALKAGGTLAPATVSEGAVRLLTIHGAKGLEAEAVLLLDTDTPERNAESMGVLIDWPGEAAFPQKFAFLVSESRPPACAAEALAAEQAARQREELNALYVALTRARHTLVISSIEPYRATTDSWWQRLTPLAQPCPLECPVSAPSTEAAPAGDSDNSQESDAGVFNLPTLPVLAALPPVDVGSLSPGAREDDDSAQARIGKAMHRLLEWGGASTAAQVAAVTREFVLSPAQAARAQALAQRILAGEGAWAWQADVLAWQGNEMDLVHEGQALRLDRLVQRQDAGHEGHWWVLDYKSADAPERQPALIAQMQTYRAAVQRAYPGATVKAAFLTGRGTLVEVL